MRLGLTGSIGCGKSTAAKAFESRGYHRLDCDVIIKERLLRRPEIIAEIAAHFGPGVLAADGQVDRPALASKVFGNDPELAWLENLLHPRLHEVWTQEFEAAPGADWVVEVPLLFEKHLEKWFDFTVCVTSDVALQLARLEQRGLPPPLARQRIAKQLPQARKMDLADFVLLNDASPDFLRAQVHLLCERLSGMS